MVRPGGVWNGKKAIVVWSGGEAEFVEPKVGGPLIYIPRKDAPGKNAFDPDEDWLDGEVVQVLFPIAPPQLAK